MRRKKNREINIFSISALDLFASAMGVFLLITIIALPYYLKADPDLVNQIGELKQKVTQLESENRRLRDQQIASLLGISTKAKSFVLVVDMSGSMEAYRDIVSETVGKIIESFTGEYRLQIIGFHEEHTLHSWKSPYQTANVQPAALKDAKAFMHSLTLQFSGGTPTKIALEEALKYDAEAIILLTDGAPSYDDPAEIVKKITALNAGKKEIYSIAIGEYRAMPILVEFLEALSRENKGIFLGVSSY